MSDTQQARTDVQVGDWVCYQQLSYPTYALVLYVLEVNSSLGRKIVTTAGECHEPDILEVRRFG